MQWRRWLRKAWWFIWEDDSLLSWVVNVILAFVLIKFVVYPGLGFMLATTHPIVAVVSGSMEHDGGFERWWGTQESWYVQRGITKDMFKGFPLSHGFNRGDIMVLHGKETVEVGDVIVFQSTLPDPIIHRVIAKGDEYYQTKGDHNPDMNPNEQKILPEQLIGYQKYGKGSVAVLRIPFLGYLKIWAVNMLCLFSPNMIICAYT